MWVAGVDGCRGGWFVVLREVGSGCVVPRLINSISEILRLPERPDIVAVDIPIGLLDRAVERGRVCDRQARALLGPRASSVFTPPVRGALAATTYNEACGLNAASSSLQMRIAQQCFGLFPKLLEVDAFMTPDRQQMVYEVHPELSFYELAGRRPMPYSKKTPQGIEDRRMALVGGGVLNGKQPSKILSLGGVGLDDVLDASAACWTAERILRGVAVRIPPNPPLDSNGLQMEMWR